MFSNVLLRNAKDTAPFINTLTPKTALQHPTWRHMCSSVLVLIQSMQLQTTPSLMVVTELSSLPSLVLANTQLWYLIVLSLWRKISKIIMLSTCFSSWHNFESAQIARWWAESNWPLKTVTNRAFAILMKSGCPGTTMPSPMMVSRDINSAFEGCCEHIDHILKACLRSWVLFCYLHSTIGTFGSCSLRYRCWDFSKPQGFCCLDCPSSPWGACSMFPPQHCWSSWGSSSTIAFLSGNLPVTTSLILGRCLQESFTKCSLCVGWTTR